MLVEIELLIISELLAFCGLAGVEKAPFQGRSATMEASALLDLLVAKRFK